MSRSPDEICELAEIAAELGLNDEQTLELLGLSLPIADIRLVVRECIEDDQDGEETLRVLHVDEEPIYWPCEPGEPVEESEAPAGPPNRLTRVCMNASRAASGRPLIPPPPIKVVRVTWTRVARPRPRGRRIQHVARATSGCDSGDPDGEHDPDLTLARRRRAFWRARRSRG